MGVEETMHSEPFHFSVDVYYEDTDFTGVVYHANYLKFFERAREHALGQEMLVNLWRERGLGFAVYKVEIDYIEAVTFGETLNIRSTYELVGEYRLCWRQEARRSEGKKAAVTAVIQIVCIDNHLQLRPIPTDVLVN
jgi:acyl-CoA thioester hydrolase